MQSDTEVIDNQIKLVDKGLRTRKKAIMVIDKVDEADADEILQEIDQENTVTVQQDNQTPQPPPFTKQIEDNQAIQ
jgi:hypothetical protein